MSDVFREVDDEVRRERASAMAKRYGPFVLGLAAIIVIGVGGWRAYDVWTARQAAEAGDGYVAALSLAEAGETEEAATAFAALAADGPEGYRILARLSAADLRAREGDVVGAVAAYRALGSEADGPLGAAARIRAAYLMVDSASYAEIDALIGGLATPGSPFAASANEALGLSAWRVGETETAEAHFVAIVSSPAATPGPVRRAEALLDLVAAGAYTPGQALAEAPAEPLSLPGLTAPTLTAPPLTDETPATTEAPVQDGIEAAPATVEVETETVPIEPLPAEPLPTETVPTNALPINALPSTPAGADAPAATPEPETAQ